MLFSFWASDNVFNSLPKFCHMLKISHPIVTRMSPYLKYIKIKQNSKKSFKKINFIHHCVTLKLNVSYVVHKKNYLKRRFLPTFCCSHYTQLKLDFCIQVDLQYCQKYWFFLSAIHQQYSCEAAAVFCSSLRTNSFALA